MFLALLSALFVLLRPFGLCIGLKSASLFPLAFGDITFNYNGRRKQIKAFLSKLEIAFHLPTPSSPRILTFLVKDVTSTQLENACVLYSAKLSELSGTLWFFPGFFRQTSGSLLSIFTGDTAVEVSKSQSEPGFLRAIRLNLTETVLQGETIRCDNIKTKFVTVESVTPSKLPVDEFHSSKKVEELENKGEDEHSVKTNERDYDYGDSDATQSRVALTADQWMIHNHRNRRMYSLLHANVEVKRPWGTIPYPVRFDMDQIRANKLPPPGTFTIQMIDALWIKLPKLHEDYKGRGKLRACVSCLPGLPSLLRTLFTDPLYLVDLHSKNTSLIYSQFQLRDAEVLDQAITAVSKGYSQNLDPDLRQGISEICWEVFVDGLRAVMGGGSDASNGCWDALKGDNDHE